MLQIPLSYSFRNLFRRKLTTTLTASGMALVIFVYTVVLMMDEGLRQTLVQTGQADNVLISRRASGTEVQSSISREQAALLETQAEIATGQQGEKMVAKELVVLIALPKKGSDKNSNVTIRGVQPVSFALRPQVKLIEGRMIRPGTNEVLVGRSIFERFQGAQLGMQLRFAQQDWTIVGLFDAEKSAFDSELWGDANVLMQAFRRPVYSAVLLKLNDVRQFAQMKAKIDADPRLTVDVKSESQFYAEQSALLANFIKYLGLALSIIFSIGAMLGAMITMYATVANRTAEIGTLRALGFQRPSILLAFLVEAILLAGLGGLIGITLAMGMQFFSISTVNWQSFSELAFSFKVTPGILLNALLFTLIMGLVGGVLPALRAARLKIVEALRDI